MSVSRIVASAPPASLAMLQGPYGFRPILFWATIHPAILLFTIVALAFNWRLSKRRRNLLVMVLVTEVVVRIATLLYFAPEVGYISSVEFSNTVDDALRNRAQRWERWNLLRLSGYVVASIMILLAVNVPVRSRSARQ